MSSSWIRMESPQSSEGVPYKRKKTWRQRGRPCEDETGVELMCLQSQAPQGLPAPLEVRRGPGTGSPPEPPVGVNLADTSGLPFWPPKQWQNKYLLFQASKFVVIRYHDLRKLIHCLSRGLSYHPIWSSPETHQFWPHVLSSSVHIAFSYQIQWDYPSGLLWWFLQDWCSGTICRCFGGPGGGCWGTDQFMLLQWLKQLRGRLGLRLPFPSRWGLAQFWPSPEASLSFQDFGVPPYNLTSTLQTAVSEGLLPLFPIKIIIIIIILFPLLKCMPGPLFKWSLQGLSSPDLQPVKSEVMPYWPLNFLSPVLMTYLCALNII